MTGDAKIRMGSEEIGPQRAYIMQNREETNTGASLRSTPLATERNPSKRECRGICSFAKCSGSQVSVLGKFPWDERSTSWRVTLSAMCGIFLPLTCCALFWFEDLALIFCLDPLLSCTTYAALRLRRFTT